MGVSRLYAICHKGSVIVRPPLLGGRGGASKLMLIKGAE
jgi:hypothetical protein